VQPAASPERELSTANGAGCDGASPLAVHSQGSGKSGTKIIRLNMEDVPVVRISGIVDEVKRAVLVNYGLRLNAALRNTTEAYTAGGILLCGKTGKRGGASKGCLSSCHGNNIPVSRFGHLPLTQCLAQNALIWAAPRAASGQFAVYDDRWKAANAMLFCLACNFLLVHVMNLDFMVGACDLPNQLDCFLTGRATGAEDLNSVFHASVLLC
jgi:hypothetical protein